MIDLNKLNYSKEELDIIRKSVIKYLESIGQNSDEMYDYDKFITYFLEYVQPKNETIH